MGICCQTPLEVGRECYLWAGDTVLVVEILGISGNTVWVSYPCDEPLEEGTGVELLFRDEERTVCYHARVAVVPTNTTSGIMLERAESADDRTARTDWRVPTNLSIWIRPPGVKEKTKGRMLDLTDGGSLIVSEASFRAGELVELIFQLPDCAAYQLVAQVVYAGAANENGMKRFGLRFVDVPRAAKEALIWYLYNRIQAEYGDDLRELYPPSASRPVATLRTGFQGV